MAEVNNFQQKQYAFAAHIRDPQNNPAPSGIEDRRMAIYRELFFNNLLKLLSGTFPVLKKIHSKERWRHIVRQFMVLHEAQTPYFRKIPLEFLSFLQNEYPSDEQDFSFLLELAHYEWVELDLAVAIENNVTVEFDETVDFIGGVPIKSKLSRVLAYQFPVHRIAADYLPKTPGEQPTYLAVFRKPDDELGFMELNPVTARLLQLIDENTAMKTGRGLLDLLAVELNYAEPKQLATHGEQAMHELHQSNILLGTVRPVT